MKLTALTNDVAIDLGTDNTRIYYKGNITIEPSVIAYDSFNGNIIAIGKDAEAMLEKNPDAVMVIKPLSQGVITDFDPAARMIEGLLGNVISGVIKPRVIVSVPCGITDVERRAVCDALKEAEIRDVFVMESPIAAALGANCDVSLARGMMLIDIGGGCCDISVISLGQTVIGRSVRLAGSDFTDILIDYILENHNLSIGRHSAERIKEEIGCAFMRDKNETALVSGFNTKLKRPEQIIIHAEETREAFEPLIKKIVAEIKSTLDEIPTELLGDIMEDGILLTGGGAQLYGLAKKLRIELGMKVFLAEDAQMCVSRGLGYVAENMDKLAESTYFYTKG